jgi:hypothetical protein
MRMFRDPDLVYRDVSTGPAQKWTISRWPVPLLFSVIEEAKLWIAQPEISLKQELC